MFANETRRLADGRIDYDHYHRRVRHMRRASRRHAARRCLRLIRPLIGAAAVATAFILIPAGAVDCLICGSKPITLVIASHD
jgi:hypothetical protein